MTLRVVVILEGDVDLEGGLILEGAGAVVLLGAEISRETEPLFL